MDKIALEISKAKMSEVMSNACLPSSLEPIKQLSELESSTDPYDQIVWQSLKDNNDLVKPLYLHQYRALYSLSQGHDVILVSPSGSGKTRVLLNGVSAVSRGLTHRGTVINGNPLCIVNTPLTPIIKDKIKDEKSFGMLKTPRKPRLSWWGADEEDDVKSTTSKPEHEYFDGTLSHVCSQSEGFTTDLGKKILKKNESRIVLHVSAANSMWGGLDVVPGYNRVFSVSGAPFLAMTTTLRNPSEIKEVKKLFGMAGKICDVIDLNPVKQNAFYSKIIRPKTRYDDDEDEDEHQDDYEELIALLRTLFLDEFIKDPFSVPTCIIFARDNEELVLAEIYEEIESEIGKRFTNNRTRPWVMYHECSGEVTLHHLHERSKENSQAPIKLYLATNKLVREEDIKDAKIIIHIKPPNNLHTLEQATYTGRAGGENGSQFASQKTISIVLYNKDEDMKQIRTKKREHDDGLTDSMQKFCETQECMKATSAEYFGYKFEPVDSCWCCINCCLAKQKREGNSSNY